MAQSATVLAYAGCSTCKKALKWLDAKGVPHTVRPIVDSPPTASELAAWVPASGVPVTKWLNTSGQSYRAIGKEKVAAASDREIERWLTEDGKLVKRPVLVVPGDGGARALRVLVGFRPEAYEAVFGG